jgi:hypothetical protein
LISAILIIEYFGAPYAPLIAIKDELSLWGVVLTAFTLLYAQVTLLLAHIRRVVEKKGGRRRIIESGIFLASFLGFLALALSHPATIYGPIFALIFTAIIVKFQLGFQSCGWPAQVNAVFRMFRVTSLESATICICYILTWLFNLPFFRFYVPALGPIGVWIATVPSMAGQRAGLIAAAIGAIIVGVRALVGKEPGLMEVEVGG